jgi:N-acetyl-anhydromuramyl-L-alanine amidase AmpD
MGYHLLDRPNPNGPFFHTSRRTCQHGVPPNQLPHIVVIHTAESEPDIHGADTGAEGVANYASTTTRSVSWHETIDSDSRIPMLPDGYVAFHVRNYNSCSVGCEIATRAHRWADLPDAWKAAVYANTAAWIDEKCRAHNIPKTLLTRSQVDAGSRGVIGHDLLDPTRRTDPGAAFDWAAVLEEDDMLKRGDTGPRVKWLQARLNWWSFSPPSPELVADGNYGATTEQAVKAFQARQGIDQSGSWGAMKDGGRKLDAHDAKPHDGSAPDPNVWAKKTDVADVIEKVAAVRTAYNDHVKNPHGKAV